MRHPARITRVLALAAAGSLVLAACGDDDDTATPSTAPSASSTATSSSAAGACKTFTDAPPPPTGTQITPPAGVAKADGVLTIGSLLPQTGDLAFLGPPEFAGVELAIKDVNAAGGVLDKPVKYIEGDSGDASQDVANATVNREIRAGADAIVGAAASSVTKLVIDKITSAGVVQMSPANTGPVFTTYADKGLYFRTAPSDVLQGRVLGQQIAGEGKSNVAIIARQDDYGTGLAQFTGLSLCNSGASVAIPPVFYDPKASNFDAQVGQIKAANPDGIVLIGFDESAKIIQAMVAQQIGPQEKSLYLVDGNIGNALGKKLPAGLLEGVKGTTPGPQVTSELKARLDGVNGALTDTTYALESYDGVVVIALAAEVAKSDAGDKIATALPDVTRGGTKCTTFKECKALLDGGTTDIDYDGLSGNIEFSDVGDPTVASIGYYTYDAKNQLDETKTQFVQGDLNK